MRSISDIRAIQINNEHRSIAKIRFEKNIHKIGDRTCRKDLDTFYWGFLGEAIYEAMYGQREATAHDKFDYLIQSPSSGRIYKIDAKTNNWTKNRNPHSNANILLPIRDNENFPEVDYFCFMWHNIESGLMFKVGHIDKHTFFANSVYIKKGQCLPNTKYPSDGNCRTMKIEKLLELSYENQAHRCKPQETY